MNDTGKEELILDALQNLLKQKSIQNITVSEIAQAAGIGKGSIYYYFPSKEAVFDALVERNYKKPIETAKSLSQQTDISPFTRMAMIFQACRDSSAQFLSFEPSRNQPLEDQSYLHQKYINHIITSLTPVLADIIQQGIALGEIHFDSPRALAEIVLIVLTVKFDTTIAPSSPEETAETQSSQVTQQEKRTSNPPGSLKFLIQN